MSIFDGIFGGFTDQDRKTLNAILTALTNGVKGIMSALTDLQGIVANIQADDVAIAAAVAAVQAAVAGQAAGSVSQADVEAAVASLAAAHSDFQTNVAALNAVANPPAPPANP